MNVWRKRASTTSGKCPIGESDRASASGWQIGGEIGTIYRIDDMDNLIKYTIGDVWSSDLTYIKFQDKFIYLAITQDIVSKEIVGFNLSNKHDADLVLKTLKEAMVKSKKPPIIFHSDRGREFLSECGNLNRFETLGELIEYIFGYIGYYNNTRIQIKLKMSPVQFKLQFVESVLEKRGT